jgi:hypothetical protein
MEKQQRTDYFDTSKMEWIENEMNEHNIAEIAHK